MQSPKLPENEVQRLQALAEYSILDTLPEEDFDNVTQIAAQICNTPIGLISLIDSHRQWFKSHRGLDVTETPRDVAFCAHAINMPNDIFVVPDSRKDERFFDNPLVIGDPHVIFYAGMPLVNPEGLPLGTICVIDNKPRELSQQQLESLRALSHQTMKLLDLRMKNRLLEESRAEIDAQNKELEKFAYVVSHDIKSPLNNIISLTELLMSKYAPAMDAEGKELIDYVGSSSIQLKNLVDGVLSYYSSDKMLSQGKKDIPFSPLLRGIADLLNPSKEYIIEFEESDDTLFTNEAALQQILINLINNGIKYNRSEKVKITIRFSQDKEYFRFSVRDNGVGMKETEIKKIFEPFVTLGVTDRFKNTGTGIGLSTVKKLVAKLGGTISVTSEPNTGTEFTVQLKK